MYDIMNALNWLEYTGLGNLTSIVLVVVTSIFVGLVYHQIRQEKEELVQKNKLETFVQIDRYREAIFNQHSVIDKLLYNPETLTNLDEIQSEVEDLLDDIEILAFKQRELNLDMQIIYDILGKIIIDVLQTDIVKHTIKDLQRNDSRTYVELVSFINKLMKMVGTD